MAKEREKIEGKASKPVANCDQLPLAAEHQFSGRKRLRNLL